MEIVLQQDFPALGYVGDRVRVRSGYARNFLIPRGIALEASLKNEDALRHRLGGVNAKRIKLRAAAEELVKKLEALSLEFTVRIGEGGKAFGSITVRDIEAALHREGYLLDRKQIKLAEPIKKAGEHQVAVKLHSEVSANLAVKVQAEMTQAQVSAEAAEGIPGEEGKKGRSAGKKAASGKEKAPKKEKPEKRAKKSAKSAEGESSGEAGADDVSVASPGTKDEDAAAAESPEK